MPLDPLDDDDDEGEILEIGDDDDEDDEDDLMFLRAAPDVLEAPYFTVFDAALVGLDDTTPKIGGLTTAEWEVAIRQYAKSSMEMFTSDEAMDLAHTLSDMKLGAELFARWKDGEVVIKSYDLDDGVEFMDSPEPPDA